MAARLLLVEDSPIVQEVVAGWLTDAGYEVTTAANGQEGLQRALEARPDLVVSDISMPLADGYWLCRQLRTHPQTGHLPIVLLTGRDHAVDILHGLDAGADAFVIKSDSGHELLDRVRRLLSGATVDPAQLKHLSEQLVLTRDRRDIFKLLFDTLQREAHFDVLALLVFAAPNELFDLFVTVSPTPLAAETSQRLFEELSATATLVGRLAPPPAQVITSGIAIVEHARPVQFPATATAALRIPLQTDGVLIAVFGVFSYAADSAVEEKIRFFFDVATEGARALRRLSL